MRRSFLDAGSGMLTEMLRDLIAHFRYSHQYRFGGDRDWLRLSILGGVLLGFSTLALAEALARKPPFDNFAGEAAMFSGAAIVLFIVRISMTAIYADWILSGALCIGVGFSLIISGVHGDMPPPVLFCLLLLASGAVRLWIGITAYPRTAGNWLCYSGSIGALVGFLGFLSPFVDLPISALSVVATDLLFHAVSIVGFGLALQDTQ